MNEAQAQTESHASAGWYPVDDGRRYWDGAAWTDHFQADKGQVDSDPDALWMAVGKPLTGIGAGKYKLTAHYLFFEKGTLRTDSQQVPIAAVLDVDVKQSMTQKARGVGNVVVHIQRPTRVEIVTMEDIANFREGQRAINDAAHGARHLIQRNQNTMRYEGSTPAHVPGVAPGQHVPGPGPSTQSPDLVEQLRKLGELRDAGILTDEEFSTKKAEILGRI